jgi:predicted ATP-grasp superfamily ATP-dependent carboligase
LLTDATWWGTLAAARDLGGRGVPVTLASDAVVAPARWSRHVTQVVRCPSTAEPRRLLDWLVNFGRRSPGHVLYPTSDETAWLISANREALGRDFRLYAPSIEALVPLLDKLRLGTAARLAGLDAPAAWCPADEQELTRVAREAAFPIYIKPRALLFAAARSKGVRVDHPGQLAGAWRAWRRTTHHLPELTERIPGVEHPLLQATFPSAERVYTVDGFVADGGEDWASMGCVKILQRPRGSGVGLCFEDTPVPPEVAQGLLRLCRNVGFHGVFDAEFIDDDGRWRLIDVNPRFYNHMAFEVERGLALPWLAYLGALGERDALRAALADARNASGGPRAYLHRLPVRIMLRLQALAGTMSAEERARWRAWIARHEGRLTDPVRQRGDAWPALAEIAFEFLRFVRHPRSYVRALIAPRS